MTVIEGKIDEKKTGGRKRQTMLDWKVTDDYGKLKEETQQWKEWRYRTFEPEFFSYLLVEVHLTQPLLPPSLLCLTCFNCRIVIDRVQRMIDVTIDLAKDKPMSNKQNTPPNQHIKEHKREDFTTKSESLPLFALWQSQSQTWIKKEDDANHLCYHIVLLNWN